MRDAAEAGIQILPKPYHIEDLAAALDEFIPSAQSLQKEMQELAAVLESPIAISCPRCGAIVLRSRGQGRSCRSGWWR